MDITLKEDLLHTKPAPCAKDIRSNSPTAPFQIIRYQHLIITMLLLIAVLFAMESTDLDMAFQRLFYQDGAWRVNNSQATLRLFAYQGPRSLLLFYAVVMLFVLCLSRFIAPFQKFGTRKNVFILLCLLLVPLVVAITKKLTHVHCPYQLQEFGGTIPYVSLFTANKVENLGRCFPAGHPSGGFALLLFVMIATTRRQQMVALAGALVLGGIMGSYQMLNGRHTLGHTLTTLLVAWIIILLVHYMLFARQRNATPKDLAPHAKD
ncbi:MAG: phosphatase PAP2 family protein [Rhodobacteraceae bacterium]|nr:phosphatase PAP2 family protein [Paracoccaceae bacterium]